MPLLVEDSDNAFVFEITFTIHEDDEGEANKALAQLLEEADKLGFTLVWRQPILI
jgi:hypothetical protein